MRKRFEQYLLNCFLLYYEGVTGEEVADIYESCESGTFDDDIAQSLAASMNMHLAKPLEFQKVIEAIAALVVQ